MCVHFIMNIYFPPSIDSIMKPGIKVLQIINVVGFIAVVIVNILANALPINGAIRLVPESIRPSWICFFHMAGNLFSPPRFQHLPGFTSEKRRWFHWEDRILFYRQLYCKRCMDLLMALQDGTFITVRYACDTGLPHQDILKAWHW